MIYGFRYGMGVVMGAACGLAVIGAVAAGGFIGFAKAKKFLKNRKKIIDITIEGDE